MTSFIYLFIYFKEIKWDKQQGGIPFPQNDVLPGDQILCKYSISHSMTH